jgi:ABC-2 type transport system permease protein
VAELQPQRAAGQIYDLGYQHYNGTRQGRGYAFRTLFGYSFLTAFGVGRGDKARQLPIVVGVLVFMPAMIMVAVGSITGRPDIINYSQHLQIASFFLALFAAGQSAELIVGDRETGTLALYLSRSLHSKDYAVAKLLALGAAFFILTFGPQFTMFGGKILLAASPWVAFKAEYGKLWPMAAGTLLISFYLGAIGMALASFAQKKNIGTALVMGFFLILPAIHALAFEIARGSDKQKYMILINPFTLMSGFGNWLYDVQARRGTLVGQADLPGQYYLWVMLGTCVLAIGALIYRYRKSEE